MPKSKPKKKPSAEKPSAENRPRRKLALGRGLGALIPDFETGGGAGTKDFFECDIDRIRPNRYQPRRNFSETELAELSRSIREQGVLQPLLVRVDGSGYELIAGERRLRAARLAGLVRIPVVVRDVGEKELLEMSIIENIQREDLNPMEEAEAYHRLMTEFELTQDGVADRVGKSRSAVANILRLRSLPDKVKSSIIDGRLSMGHARALLGAEGAARQLALWRTVLSRGLSVRETEEAVKRLKVGKSPSRKPERRSEDVFLEDLAGRLSVRFGTRVRIRRSGKRGRVEIEFYSDQDLDRLLGLLEKPE
jgi:ParB family transcriptional regulator, chromosome partitioning protein